MGKTIEEKEEWADYMRKWNRKNPQQAREIWRKARKSGKKAINDKRYYQKTKEKHLFENRYGKYKFKNKVRDYTLYHFKGLKIECSNCKERNNLQFHHLIYRLPTQRKDFIVLCRPCHERLDWKKPNELISDRRNKWDW